MQQPAKRPSESHRTRATKSAIPADAENNDKKLGDAKKKPQVQKEKEEEEEDDEEEGILQKKLEILALQIGRAGLYAAIFTVLWLSVDYSFDKFLIKKG